jgi:hypothetical protein
MNRSPWILLAATALFAAVSGHTYFGGVSAPSVGSVGTGPQGTSGQIVGGSPESAKNSRPIPTTARVEWLGSEPIVLTYVPAPAGSGETPKLRGKIGLRKVGNSKGERVSFSIFRVETDTVPRNDVVLEQPAPIVLSDGNAQLVDIVVGIQPQCFFKKASFHRLLFTSLERPTSCFPLEGYIAAYDMAIKPEEAADPNAEQQLLSWTTPLPLSTDLEAQVMAGSTAWAAGVVALALIVCWMLGLPPWSLMDGTPNWDFSRSWAANIALGGGLMGALVTFASLNATILNKSTYSFFALWTTALLAIGPMLYVAFSWTKTSPNTPTEPITCSPVGLFFAASFVVLWAALMQLRLVRILLAELRLDKTITDQIESWTSVSVGAIALVLVIYSPVSLIRTAVNQRHYLAVRGERPRAHWPLL